MKKKRYGQEFKEQIIRECQEVGNAALVARRHGISKNTVHSWLQASRRNGSVVPLPIKSKKFFVGIGYHQLRGFYLQFGL